MNISSTSADISLSLKGNVDPQNPASGNTYTHTFYGCTIADERRVLALCKHDGGLSGWRIGRGDDLLDPFDPGHRDRGGYRDAGARLPMRERGCR